MAILFFAALALFVLGSFYIAARVCHAFKGYPTKVRCIIWGIVIFLDISFFLLRMTSGGPIWLNRILYVVSTTWMPVVMYGLMVIGTMDIIRNALVYNGRPTPFHTPAIVRTGGIVCAILVIWGYITATTPEDQQYHIYTDKMGMDDKLRITLVSDLHTGYAVTERDITKMVEIINSTSPDLVLIAGDLIDGDLAPVIAENTCGPISGIKSRLGVVAVMGNHEYMDDDQAAERYIRGISGLTLLRDSAIVRDGIRIIGRDDLSHSRVYGSERASMDKFGVSDSLFTIVMDHQPGAISDARKINADLYVGGHTHAGQIWPMNIITGMIYDLDYGFACYGRTNAVVTSGYGTWGPRMRIDTQSEIVTITVEGTKRVESETAETEEADA